MNDPLPALSIRQPWAWAILELPPEVWKDCENRSKPIPAKYLNTPVLIQTGQKPYHLDAWDMIQQASGHRPPPKEDLPLGQLVGACIFTDCVTRHGSQWFFGDYGWVIGPRVAFEEPVICTGQLGFWKPPEQELLVNGDYQAPHKLVVPPAPNADIEIPGRYSSW
jgi:hypothetical protein